MSDASPDGAAASGDVADHPARDVPATWLLRFGLTTPPSHAESARLIQQSHGQYRLARRVGLSASDPRDGAPHLRRAFCLLLLARVRLGDREITTWADCQEHLTRSPALQEKFDALWSDLAFVDELLLSFERGADEGHCSALRYAEALDRMPQHYRTARRQLDASLHEAGGNPMARRAWIGFAVVAPAAVVFALARVLTQGGPASAELAGPAGLHEALPAELEPPDVVDDPERCFLASYFSDQHFGNLIATRRECRIAYDWGFDPAPGVPSAPADQFSVLWEGVLAPPSTDTYTFYLRSDDGSRMYLNDELIVDNWGNHGVVEKSGGPKELREDAAYTIRVEYYEAGHTALVQLLWSSSTFDKKTLSGRYVSPPKRDASPQPHD